jgi:hypothetical protein
MEAVGPSETSGSIYKATWRNILEDSHIQKDAYSNPGLKTTSKSYGIGHIVAQFD